MVLVVVLVVVANMMVESPVGTIVPLRSKSGVVEVLVIPARGIVEVFVSFCWVLLGSPRFMRRQWSSPSLGSSLCQPLVDDCLWIYFVIVEAKT